MAGCRIRTNGGSITVRLTADNLLVAGARFELKQGNTIIEHWDMKTGDDGADEHQMATPASQLPGKFLQWRINVCSMHPAVDSGTVAVTVSQDSLDCPIDPVAQYNLTEVPQCSSGNATQIDDSADFVVV